MSRVTVYPQQKPVAFCIGAALLRVIFLCKAGGAVCVCKLQEGKRIREEVKAEHSSEEQEEL